MIFLVLLVSWLEMSPDVGLQIIEYFAGAARIAKVAVGAGYKTEAYDLEFGRRLAELKGKRSSMDINSNAGMVLLSLFLSTFVVYTCCCGLWPVCMQCCETLLKHLLQMCFGYMYMCIICLYIYTDKYKYIIHICMHRVYS